MHPAYQLDHLLSANCGLIFGLDRCSVFSCWRGLFGDAPGGVRVMEAESVQYRRFHTCLTLLKPS